MSVKRMLSYGLVAVVLASAAPLRADFKPEDIQRGKRSAALIVLQSRRGFGSAFCIDPAGYFITNEHVVKSGVGERVTLVVNPTEKDEKSVEAKVVRVDKQVDLALLHVLDANGLKLTGLELGDEKDLVETQQLVAFGYPFGTSLAVKEQKYPSVSVNVGRITSLRKNNGKLERIQLDAQLNPGNSGGPVLDSAGRVVGIVNTGVLRSGVNFAVPVKHLSGFLSRPELLVDVPELPYEKRHDPIDITVRVIRFGKARPPLKLDVEIPSSSGKGRRFNGTSDKDDVFHVRIVPVERQAETANLPIVITYDDGSIRCKTMDQPVQLDGKAHLLSTISRIEFEANRILVEMKDGQQLTGKAVSLNEVRAVFGGYSLNADVRHARSLVVYEPGAESESVPVRVTARAGDDVLAQVDAKIELVRTIAKPSVPGPVGPPRGVGPLRTGGIYHPPTVPTLLKEDKVVYKLPEPYTRYTVGGSGRYLIFHLKAAKKVVIMDVTRGETAAEIPGVADDVLLAASAKKLMLVMPGQVMMQRWSLETFQREKVARLPGKGATVRALLGCNGSGPLLLGADDAHLVDLETLKPIQVDGSVSGAGKSSVEISANGLDVCSIPRGYGPVSYDQMRIKGNKVSHGKFSSTSNAVRWAWPTADGSLITMPGGNLFDVNLKPITAKWLHESTLFPTVDPRYFLSIRFAADTSTKEKRSVTHVNVCTTADCRIVHTYVGLPEMAPVGNTSSSNAIFTNLRYGERRYHWIPWAGVLITMPYDNQEVIVRRFDLSEALEKSGVDYLFVDSVPPSEAFKGQTLVYPIQVRSKRGRVRFTLETGPKGMKVSEKGVLTWNVPPDFAEESTQAIVTVTDAASQDVFHSMRMAVHEPAVVQPAATSPKAQPRPARTGPRSPTSPAFAAGTGRDKTSDSNAAAVRDVDPAAFNGAWISSRISRLLGRSRGLTQPRQMRRAAFIFAR